MLQTLPTLKKSLMIILKNYIDSIISSLKSGIVDPTDIEKALAGFSMPNDISDPDAQITHYCADFFERLESVGHGDFKEKIPKLIVKILMKKPSPKEVNQGMVKRV